MKQKTRKWITTVIVFLYAIIIVSSVALIGESNKINYIGFHNQDLSVNGMIFEAKYNTTLIDTASDFKRYNMTEGYIMGNNQQRKAFTLSNIGWFGFGISFMYLMSMINFNKS